MGKLIFLPTRTEGATQEAVGKDAPTNLPGHFSHNLPEQLHTTKVDQGETRERRPTLGHVFGAPVQRPVGLDSAAGLLYDERLKTALHGTYLGYDSKDPNSLEAMKTARVNLSEGEALFRKNLGPDGRPITTASGLEMILEITESNSESAKHVWQAKVLVNKQPCANIGLNVHKELGKLVISIVSIAAFDPAVSQADQNWASSAVRAIANKYRDCEIRGINAEESGYAFHDKAFKLAGFKKVLDQFGKTKYWTRNAE